MKTQEDFLNEALNLKAQFPEMEIHICVDSGDIADGSSWTAHKIVRVELSPWYQEEERIITDLNEIKGRFLDEIDLAVSQEEAEKIAAARCSEETTTAICIYTQAE